MINYSITSSLVRGDFEESTMSLGAQSDCCLGNLLDNKGTGVRRELYGGIGLYSQGMVEQGMQEDFLRTECGTTGRERVMSCF